MTQTIGLDALDAQGARRFHHVPGLDGVRAVAVLLVVGLHVGALWTKVRPGGLVPGGYAGVDMFFVLSGFLITSLLVSEKAITGGVAFTKFYARRALRLLPALYFVLIAHAVYFFVIGGSIVTEIRQIVAVVLYVSNFAQIYWQRDLIRSGIGMTWSLAIEEQFYLLWPAVLVLGVLRFARTRNTVLWTIGLAALASALMRVIVWNWGSAWPAAYMRPDCRADGLLIGALCAFLWRWDLVPTRWLSQAATLSAAFLVFVAFFVKAGDFAFNIGFTLISLASGVIILAVVMGVSPLVRPMQWAPLRLLGKVSYGVYLWHILAIKIARHALGLGNRPLLAVTSLAICAVAVTVSWHLVEQPFLRLKSKVASPVSY